MVAQYAAANIFPFTAVNEGGRLVGHIMLRYPEPIPELRSPTRSLSKTTIHFGFIIVDDSKRGKDYGKQML